MAEIPVNFTTNAPQKAREVDQLAEAVKREAAAQKARAGAMAAILRKEQDAIRSARELRREIEGLTKAQIVNERVGSRRVLSFGGVQRRSNFGSDSSHGGAGGSGKTGFRGFLKGLSAAGGSAGMLGGLGEKMGLSPAFAGMAAAAVTFRATMQVVNELIRHNADAVRAEIEGRQKLGSMMRDANKTMQANGLGVAKSQGNSLLQEIGLTGGTALSERFNLAGVSGASEAAAMFARLPQDARLRANADSILTDSAKTGLIGGPEMMKWMLENQGAVGSATSGAAIISQALEGKVSEDHIRQIINGSGRGVGGSILDINGISGQTANVGIGQIPLGVGAARQGLADARDGGLSSALIEQTRIETEQLTVLREIYKAQSGMERFFAFFQGSDSARNQARRAERLAGAGN